MESGIKMKKKRRKRSEYDALFFAWMADYSGRKKYTDQQHPPERPEA
jgi:hypothetical protein